MAKAVREKREAWKTIEGFRDRGEQPPTGLMHLYDHKYEGNQEGGGQNTGVYGGRTARKFAEYGGKNMLFKMARDRTEDGIM